jgi:AraC-like DNA-binding protein
MFNSQKINNYLNLMKARGVGRDDVLAATAIAESDLENPAFRATLVQSQKLIENMLDLTGNEFLGFEFGREITIADMGVVGYGMLTSPTFREVTNLWINYAPILYGTMIQATLQEDLHRWSILINESLPVGPSYRFCTEEFLMQVLKLGEKLRGFPVEYAELTLIYPKPENASYYDGLFQCPVKFNASVNRITVASPPLDEIVQTRDKYMYQVYLDYCARMTAGIEQNQHFSERARQYFVKHLGRELNIEDMAAELNCSTSTLRRRLLEEGTTFSDLLSDFRHRFAEEYLKSTNMSAKQVGYLLGYRNPKSFLRAFKAWTGVSVGEYKRASRHLKR